MNPATTSTRVSLTRATIVTAAVRIVSESGLEALSLRHLASELGVTAPALYVHVRDKSDLVAAVAESGFRQLLDEYAEIHTTDPLDRIRRQCRVYVDLAVANPGMFQAMFLYPPPALAPPDRAPDELTSLSSEAFDDPAAAIVAAIEQGAIHPDRDPFVTSLTMWTAAHGLAQVFQLDVVPADVWPQLVESLVDATLLGLQQPPAG